MRDEGDRGRRRHRGRPRRATLLAAALAAGLAAHPAPAQTVRGYAQVQYQSQDQRGGQGADVEWWLRAVHLDYGGRVRNAYDVTLQGEWNDLSYVGRPDRQVNPRGSLRLAHRDFGGYASYRPLRVTDALGVTTRQRETTLNAYLRRPGLPQIQGTYLRRRSLAVGLTPASTGITGTLSARHDLGPLSLRGSWNNQVRFTDLDRDASRVSQNSLGAGADWRWTRNRTSANASLDLQQTRLSSRRGPTSRSGGTSVALGGTHRLSKVFDAGLVYGYRHSSTRSVTTRNIDDHDGSLLLTARPKPSLTFSAGGGLRTTGDAQRREIERYLVSLAGVQGRIRPGWTGNASLSRSYNWLPNRHARPVDAALVNTHMRLVRGLDADAQAQVTAARANTAIADTAGSPTTVTSQIVYGLTATPLRPVSIGFSRAEYRTGSGVFDPDARSRSDNWNARWNPVPSLRFSGTLSRSRGLGARDPALSTVQATLEWSPMPSVQWSGSYSRSDRSQFSAATQTVAGRDVWGLRLLASIGKEWRALVSVNDVDPGQPTHVRQWDATLTRNVGR